MTNAHRQAMQRGRAQATARRHRREDAQLRHFRQWLRRERDAYTAYRARIEMFGAGSKEARAAYRHWSRVLRESPHLPPDGAFRRERGENASEDVLC